MPHFEAYRLDNYVVHVYAKASQGSWIMKNCKEWDTSGYNRLCELLIYMYVEWNTQQITCMYITFNIDLPHDLDLWEGGDTDDGR